MSTTLAVAMIALVVAAIAAGALVVINALRHETEESPAARRAALARVSARARAQSPAPPALDHSLNVVFEDGPVRRLARLDPQAIFESAILGGRQVFESEQGAILTAPPGVMKGAPDGFRELSVDEMRERIVQLRRQPLTRSQSLDRGEGRRRVVEFSGIPVVADETVERDTLELRFGCTQSRHFVGDSRAQLTSCECGALLVSALGDGCAVSLVGISVQPHTLSEQELARRRAQAGGDAA